MKRYARIVIACFLIVFVVASIGMAACESSAVGKYVDQSNPQNYVELNKDGTAVNVWMGFRDKGTWEVKGDQLTVSLSGLPITATIKGNKIFAPGGQVLVKK